MHTAPRIRASSPRRRPSFPVTVRPTKADAIDAIEMLDALGVSKFAVAEHDWGSNVAETLAVGWPDRVDRIAMLSTPPRLGGLPTSPFWHARMQARWSMLPPIRTSYSLKRSTKNLQLSTRWAGRLPHLSGVIQTSEVAVTDYS
jgi:pimeloyl-ACP methyl ester carboxylesterase